MQSQMQKYFLLLLILSQVHFAPNAYVTSIYFLRDKLSFWIIFKISMTLSCIPIATITFFLC